MAAQKPHICRAFVGCARVCGASKFARFRTGEGGHCGTLNGDHFSSRSPTQAGRHHSKIPDATEPGETFWRKRGELSVTGPDALRQEPSRALLELSTTGILGKSEEEREEVSEPRGRLAESSKNWASSLARGQTW